MRNIPSSNWYLIRFWFTFLGDIENEDEILEWLLSQLEKDEIEDVTDEMLDRLVKEGKTLAVLFCEFYLPSFSILYFHN